MGSELNRTN